MIRITWGQLLGRSLAARIRFASIRRISMLRCNIALAARGANSQLSGGGRGGVSQHAATLRPQPVGIFQLSCLARLLLGGEQEICQGSSRKMSARENQVALPLRSHT